MPSYLSFATQADAVNASRNDWLIVLGRAKRPGDVTEFLWGVLVNPDDGTALGAIPDTFVAMIPAQEQAALLPDSSPLVTSTLNAIALKIK